MRSRSGSLDPDTALGIKISATISRDRYETDPAEIQRVIDDVYKIAGDRLDILAHEVGLFIGFYEDQHTITLTTALRALPLDMADAIALGEYRRNVPMHGAPDPTRTRAASTPSRPAV